ncbi:MAG: hypothetical protein LBH57_03230 [Treponema sp.]|jgi:hypothetical protein|nr:hypothetical protein [Treponema sp.]
MAKKIVVMQFLFFLSFRAYSFVPGISLNLGVMGIGVSFENTNVAGYFWGNIGTFAYQSSWGFGVNVSPVHFFSDMNDPTSYSLTFVNTSVFYNFLKHDHLILGPFGSVNAVMYNRPDFFEFHGGITFLIRNINFFSPDFYKNSILGVDFLVVELGYTYNNKGGQGFYIRAGMDLLSILFQSKQTELKEDFDEYQKEHPVY